MPNYAAGFRWFAALAAVGVVLVVAVVVPRDSDDSIPLGVVLSAWPLAFAPLFGLLRAWWRPGRTRVRAAGLTRGERILGPPAAVVVVASTGPVAATIASQNVPAAVAGCGLTVFCFEVFMRIQWKVRLRTTDAPVAVDLERTPGVVEVGVPLAMVVLASGVAAGESAAALGIAALIVAWSVFVAYVRTIIALVERRAWIGYLVSVASLVVLGAVLILGNESQSSPTPELIAIVGSIAIALTAEAGRRRAIAMVGQSAPPSSGVPS